MALTCHNAFDLQLTFTNHIRKHLYLLFLSSSAVLICLHTFFFLLYLFFFFFLTFFLLISVCFPFRSLTLSSPSLLISLLQSSGQQIPVVVESCIRFINLHGESVFILKQQTIMEEQGEGESTCLSVQSCIWNKAFMNVI